MTKGLIVRYLEPDRTMVPRKIMLDEISAVDEIQAWRSPDAINRPRRCSIIESGRSGGRIVLGED
jgi:hypothetical protein